MTETESRYEIYRILTTIKHGAIGDIVALYTELLEKDPAFMVPMAAWLQANHPIRDVVNGAVAGLIFYRGDDPYLQSWVREKGLGILNQLSIRQVRKVLEYGLSKGSLPRSVKTEVFNYLKKLEKHPNWDRVALGARKDLLWLYRKTYTPFGDLAQACLVDKKPPRGTAFWALQEAPKIPDLYERARFLLKYDLPYLVLTTFVSPRDPVGLLALVEAMTPQQLANNLAMLKRGGLEANKEVLAYVNEKLDKGAKENKVNVGRLGVAADKLGTPFVEKILDDVIRQYAIRKNTAIFIDKSASMEAALDLLRHIGPYIAKAAYEGGSETDYIVFNSYAQRLSFKDYSYRGFQEALAPHRPAGATSFGAPILALRRPVDQMVYLTDQAETSRPGFLPAYEAYCKEFGVFPNVVVIHLSGVNNEIIQACIKENIPCDRYDFTGDYNQITPILQLLSGKPFSQIIEDILAYKIPERLKS